MKKVLKALMVLVMILNIIGPVTVMASPSEAEMDAVLVIDASLSMKTNDPQKLGLEAVKMFVDMLGETENQVGIITYAKAVDKTYPMTEIQAQADKEAVKQFVDTIERNLNYTDISQGLTEAVKMLDGRKVSENKPLIVVFTDGNNDIRGLNSRTDADIASDLNKAIEGSVANQYPVYTVGLNARGELNEAYLKDIADKTSGKAFATNNPADLPNILTQIFADQLDVKVMPLKDIIGTGDFEEVPFTIPNASVLEANISATASQPIVLKLVSPDGVEQPIPSADITMHQSKTYQLLKLKKPEEGDWVLYVKGVKGDAIGIDLVYNYEVGVSISPLSNTEYREGETLQLEAFLSLDGKPIDDKQLYSDVKAKLILKDKNTNSEIKLDMINTGENFKIDYLFQQTAEYEAKVAIEAASFNRESDPISLKVVTQATKPSPPPMQPEVQKEQEEDNPKLAYILGGLLAAVILTASLIGVRAFKRTQIPLVGQLVIEIRENTTGKLQPPQYKKLHVFKGKVSLHALLQYAPEFKETEQILLKSAPGDKVYLYNQSQYAIEKAGRAVSAGDGLELRKNDRLTVNIADSGQTVQIEYLL